MRKTANVALITLQATAVVQIVLGLLFWMGIAKGLVPLHIAVGAVLVIALWTLSVIGVRAKVGAVLTVSALVWGLLTLGLGMGQHNTLKGSSHWIIEVIHFGVGLIAIGMGSVIGKKLKKTVAPTSESTAAPAPAQGS